jgi:DNA mismatch endonuclease (patch repair protein)
MLRSEIMRAVKRSNTGPEIAVRKSLHALGFRFRLHRRDLPGSPDIVLPKYKAVIFVHGCFWHRHPGCRYASSPKSRMDYWVPKFKANIARDARNQADLLNLGWAVHTVWECETRVRSTLDEILRAILANPGSQMG